MKLLASDRHLFVSWHGKTRSGDGLPMMFLLKKLVPAALTVFGSVTLVFLLAHVIPGDPVENLLGEQAMPLDKAKLRSALRLDLPLSAQYAAFWGDVLDGTLGRSFYREGVTVASLVAERFPRTLVLGIAAMLFAVGIAIPLGVLAAARKGGPIDMAAMVVSMAGLSLPSFFLGPILLLIFCRWLGWLPPPAAGGGLQGILLPAITLGMSMAALLSRMTRASMLDALGEGYITTARARGLSPAAVYIRHALRNALLPIVTVMGIQFGALLAGTVITERVFAWPGMGSLVVEAIEKRDFPVVQGCMLVISLCYVAVNFFTDLLYSAIDPRVRGEG
jgi:peptide/nickel transport system permease protein